jgi:hypothetical protein
VRPFRKSRREKTLMHNSCENYKEYSYNLSNSFFGIIFPWNFHLILGRKR